MNVNECVECNLKLGYGFFFFLVVCDSYKFFFNFVKIFGFNCC